VKKEKRIRQELWQNNYTLIIDANDDKEAVEKHKAARRANLAIRRILWMVEITRRMEKHDD